MMENDAEIVCSYVLSEPGGLCGLLLLACEERVHRCIQLFSPFQEIQFEYFSPDFPIGAVEMSIVTDSSDVEAETVHVFSEDIITFLPYRRTGVRLNGYVDIVTISEDHIIVDVSVL